MSDSRQQWLKGRAWDTFFLLGGIWLIPLVVVLYAVPQQMIFISLALTGVLWLSHRVATFWTVFCTPAYRALIRAEPIRFICVPVLVLLLSVAFAMAPYPPTPLVRLQILGTLFVLFNSYHFGVQHFGVLTIYRIKAGQQLSESVRLRERRACLFLGGVLVLVGQLLHGADVVRESLFMAIIPARDLFWLRLLGGAVALWVGGRTIRDEICASVPSVPKVLYKGALVVQAGAAFFLSAIPFLMLWAVQHWLVSVGLALLMTTNSASHDPSVLRGIWQRGWRVVLRSAAISGATLTTFSVLFTPILLIPIKVVSGDPSAMTIPSLGQWFGEHETVTMLLVGVNFGSVFCHFLYDRAVFRFSHAPTRAISSRLLFANPGSGRRCE